MPLNGKTKHEILQEFRHAEILEAARRVFSEKGFDQASVDEIAHAAGVAKGTVYLYYPSKRELYLETLKSGLEAMCAELEQDVLAARGAEARIRAFMDSKMRFFEKNCDLFRIYNQEFSRGALKQAEAHEHFIQYFDRQHELLSSVIQEGIRARVIRKVPVEQAAFAILHMTRIILCWKLLGWNSRDTAGDMDIMFDLAWKGLAGK
jgi:AcrR family transcriptional regulator